MKKELRTKNENEVIVVEVSYNKGGVTLATMMGYAEGAEPRGYWLHVRRETVRDGFRQFMLGDGLRVFLLEVKRQSPKALAQAEKLAEAKEREVVEAYLRKKGLELAVVPERVAQHQELEASDGVFRNLSPIEAAQAPVFPEKVFRVVAVSSNTNSFGLHGIVMLAKDGTAYQAARSQSIDPLKKGDEVRIRVVKGELNFGLSGFEIPRKLPAPRPEVLREVFGQEVA